jgi:hypothetical protein
LTMVEASAVWRLEFPEDVIVERTRQAQ